MIFGVIALAALTFVVLLMLRRREDVIEIDGSADGEFPEMAVIVHPAESIADDGDADISTPCTRRARLYELKVAQRRHVVRARRVLVLCVFAVLVLTVTSALHSTPWWSVAVAGGAVIMTLVASRLTMMILRPGFEKRAAAIREGNAEDTVVFDFADHSADTHDIELSAPITYTGSLWDPVPVTMPTYVQKPLAPRTVRTIDLSAPTAAAPALPPTADPLAPTAVEAAGQIRRVG